ncbi:hypothetical protein [Halobellus inordinatus]|uniref:hypothetical protein n=1 Tax=Halobellus inordinatus TaxID=1126236 RepID=UPI002114753B|nr:hypothetical protein [Halobellus ramosii]
MSFNQPQRLFNLTPKMPNKAKIAAVGIIIGAIAGTYSALYTEVPALYFSALATVQGSIFGVVAAIYILSRQLAASEYSSHALSTFRQEGAYKKIVSIFGISILIDLAAVATINLIQVNFLYRVITTSTTIGFAIVSFVLLYSMRNELLDHIDVESVEENIKRGVNGRNWQAEIAKDTGFPFYQYFETTRSAIRNDDRQAAYTVFESLISETSSNLDDHLSSSPSLSENLEDGYVNLVNEVKAVGVVAAEEGYTEILPPVIKWLNGTGEKFSNLPSERVSDKVIRSVSTIHHKLIPSSQLDTIGTGVWWGYSEVLSASAEADQEDPIRSGTYAIGDLIAIASEEHEEFDVDKSSYSLIVRILLTQFMDSWNQHAKEHLSDINHSDLLYGDPKSMEPGEFEYNHNYFEDTLRSVSTHITSADRSFPLPTSGFHSMCDTIVEGVGDLAKKASENGQPKIVEYYLLTAVLIAHGFDDFSQSAPDVRNSFVEIYEYNDCCQRKFESVIDLCKDEAQLRQQKAYFHYTGAFVHQDYEISELEEYADELEDWFGI